MNLEELKKEAIKVLGEYEYAVGHSYETTNDGIDEVFDEWKTQKKDILKAFEKHPNYNGRGQIVLTEEYAREVDHNAIYENINQIIDIIVEKYKGLSNKLAAEAVMFLRGITICYETQNRYLRNTVSDMFHGEWNLYNELRETVSVQEGQKTLRVLRKLFVKLGLDKEPDFEKYYAKFSDAINPLKVIRYTILSVNPIDYWAMSFGNSWASCHTIDKTNKRHTSANNHQGCYSGGTESYMLDPSSIVVYTVDKKDDISKPELCDKVTRCMFHIGEEKIVQGRLYPQTNDGDGGAYKQIREIVQRVISEIWDVPNYWTNEKGVDICCDVILSSGVHYRDYESFNNCNVSFLKKEPKNYKLIRVGADPICPTCGRSHSDSGCIVCYECAESICCDNCGGIINPNDCIIIGNECYCDGGCAERAGYVWSECQEDWLCRDDCYYDDWAGDYFDDEYDTVITVDGSYYMNQENAENAGYAYVESDGEWHPRCDVYYCQECDKYFLEEDYDFEHECCNDCAPEEREEDEDDE